MEFASVPCSYILSGDEVARRHGVAWRYLSATESSVALWPRDGQTPRSPVAVFIRHGDECCSLATRWPEATESSVGIAQQMRRGINRQASDRQYSCTARERDVV